LITLTADALNEENQTTFCNRHTNWEDFGPLVKESVALNIPFNTAVNIKQAAKFFNDTIQCVGWNATTEHRRTLQAYDCPIIISNKLMKEEDSTENGNIYVQPQGRGLLDTATHLSLLL
jgi:hypothetical protein